MFVRDAMTEIVVTVGPDHTLQEAARRMTARNVGAAVVIDDEMAGPGILTERDILRSIGRDESLEQERVRDHLSPGIVFAAPHWSLERAANEMVRGSFRHVIVVDAGDVVGILSIRDVVRCWMRDGATADVAEGAALS
jgi:CBS domain-containing protein